MSEKPCGAYFFAFFENFFVPILTSGGYVGLSIATLLSQHHQVTAVDIIPEKVEMINNRKSPIQDDYIEKYLAEKELNLTATLDAKTAYADADFVVIAAPKDDSWVQLLNDQKNFGIHGPESVCFVGGNAKMNEFQAAMGICNLRHLDEEIAKRKKVVERYRERLSGVEGIKLSAIQENVESNYAYFPVVFDGYKYTRNEIFEMLSEQGITARKYFYPLTNSFECYRNYPTAGTEKTPVAQHLALRVLTLPLYADLPLEDVNHICDIILN